MSRSGKQGKSINPFLRGIELEFSTFTHIQLETSTLLAASSVILTAHIGQALTTHRFSDWQVVHSASEIQYLAGKLTPSYIIIDISMVESNLGDYCAEIAAVCDAAIILMLSHTATSQITADIAIARKQCEQILEVFEFPIAVEKLVEFMTEHRNHRAAINVGFHAQTSAQEMSVPPAGQPSSVEQWIQDHPDIISSTYLNPVGKTLATHGESERGQGEAAQYILGIGRSLGEKLGLSNVLAAHHHGPRQKFLTVDAGEHIIAFNCKSKAVLRDLAGRYQA